nr:hypothetical protein CFP56_36728 [Quercus suber]
MLQMARWDKILSLPAQNPPTLEFSAADLVWSKVEEARRQRRPEMTCKPKVDGILEYILTTYVPKKKNAGRLNTKRGCTCHFIVKRLIAEPSVALIIYTEDKHVDKKGLPCHGPQDTKAARMRAMFAPYISEDLHLRVLSLLHVGVSVETILQRHSESVVRQGGPSNHDDQLSHRYVRRQKRSIQRSTYELDTEDPVSISILLVYDSRFGTNKLKYPIHSLVVFNLDKKAIPVAWIIAPRFANSDVHRWMRALYNRVCTKDPTWKLTGFIFDDPLVNVLTIRDVFDCCVLICFWRVRHAWHKNLVKKCLEPKMRVEISRRLEQAVDDICRGQGTVNLFEDLLEDFIDESDFMDYSKAIWYPRIEAWTVALKSLPLASQETCAAMEFYHSQMKLRLLNEKDPGVYQRADWLVDKLDTKLHSYFWLNEYSGKDDFARYWKDEWMSGLTSWRKALKIPDSDVVIQGGCAKVADQLVKDKV